ncbi:hypothetical protein BDV95DRAFT_27009 [Massariosphaeria phaeospora]|uniref:Uncharacterized protein n=1 Tax=Massariosphaeria phaeospora TaxID=100035 RepID=A0A7C8IE34_9PLEO|nr:hypothetical protein BDV95DRAFT_27009 [Massariosphaeria phaeospora]
MYPAHPSDRQIPQPAGATHENSLADMLYLYKQNLVGTVGLLEQTMQALSEGTQPQRPALSSASRSHARARKVLDLLKHMTESYGAGGAATIDREEMQIYVTHAVQCVEKAMLESGKRRCNTMQKRPASVKASVVPVRAVGGPQEPLYPEQLSARKGELVLRADAALSAPIQEAPTVHKVTVFTAVRRESDEDTASVLTNPWSPSTVSSPVTESSDSSHSQSNPTPLVCRDDWDCDFCGPECFCLSLED